MSCLSQEQGCCALHPILHPLSCQNCSLLQGVLWSSANAGLLKQQLTSHALVCKYIWVHYCLLQLISLSVHNTQPRALAHPQAFGLAASNEISLTRAEATAASDKRQTSSFLASSQYKPDYLHLRDNQTQPLDIVIGTRTDYSPLTGSKPAG